MKKDRIVVIGSSNVDLLMKMDRLPEKGETVTDAVFMQVYGGKGANQAVGAARAGGKVSFINSVGEDAYTPRMVRNYQDDGIDTSFVFREKGLASGHALIMIGDDGHNYLSVAPGANYKLTPARIDEAMQVIEQAAIIIMQYEILAVTITHVLELAGALDIPVMFNFAPARDFDLNYLSKVNTLVVNEIEASFLAGRAVSNEKEAEEAAGILLQKGTGNVIMTLGEKGAFLMNTEEKIFVPAYKVDALDTTSAGDVFCGTYAVAMVEGRSIREALQFACAASALCVTRMGAQPSAPARHEIDEFINDRQ